MVEKESIKVVIRTRPTPDFASKNINIDQNTQVSFAAKCLLDMIMEPIYLFTDSDSEHG